MKRKINYLAILLFYVIAICCRYLTNKTNLVDSISIPYFKAILTGVGPALGALVVFFVFRIKPVMTLKGNYKNMIMPLIIFWLLPIASISSISYFTIGELPWLTVLSILIYGLLEEIGWRGFLYQELKALPLVANIIIVATLWFVWHLNFEITSSNILFFGILILGSWGIGKVADASYSLLAVSAFHSLNNFFPKLESKQLLILAVLLIIWILSLVIKKKIQKKIA